MSGDGDEVDEVTAEVVHTDRGWQVALETGDEQRLQDEVYDDQESARRAARTVGDAADRWDDAGREQAPHPPEHEQGADE